MQILIPIGLYPAELWPKHVLQKTLKCILKHGTCKNDVILMKYTSEGEDLNKLALSLCPSKERKIESIEMGNAFRKVLSDSWDFKLPENTAYPIAVAKAAKDSIAS